MNIRDKHRVLEPAQGALVLRKDGINPRIQFTDAQTVNSGDVFARVPADLDPDVEFSDRITRQILIPISRPAGGVPLARIGEIYGCVAFDVLPRFFELFDPLPATVKVPEPPNP